ncbi:AAA family ATPase [Marinobacter confluentis]|uniref:AAA+ ATPase domain-containing protein n=1 Tax=Marinobacter confluentis TaxID=1697557 RepID=A0A4Z1BYQ2_9GAMM|nr:AAA family ATPase [Marinobacter confluentis]TGN39798.1 hypothetical protein E5Q11_05695 [Marinobacter confluentis]
MSITFRKESNHKNIPTKCSLTGILVLDNWDDFGHKTLFDLIVFNESGERIDIGNLKIAYVGHEGGWTATSIDEQFTNLDTHFFSLGQDADYYRNIVEKLGEELAEELLLALGDVVHDPKRLEIAKPQGSFQTSLLRTVNEESISNQFKRILNHEAPLTQYDFFYEKEPAENFSGIRIDFKVKPESKPSSNIHVLIGRNGVGKTTLLNNMVHALLPDTNNPKDNGFFAKEESWIGTTALPDDYFAGIVSVSFSAFDPFVPPKDKVGDTSGIKYNYIGLKKRSKDDTWSIKDKADLSADFTKSLRICFNLGAKRNRWLDAVRRLESDINFADMRLRALNDLYKKDDSDNKRTFVEQAAKLFYRMSSGHAVVLLTITKLVETVEEKTLVLIDEPESHLHPPLISAFTRALSDLLVNRNGLAIIATHSPVVLQEVPRDCVSILRRARLQSKVEKPEQETFAENVGTLTREVFGLEVSKSGFYDLLATDVEKGMSYEEIEAIYSQKIGFEGRALLRALISSRDRREGAN